MKPYPQQITSAKILAKLERGCVSAPTGFGKSIMMALLVTELQVKTLVVVPSVELKSQLRATFKSIFGSLDNITVENIDSKNLQKQGDYGLLIIDEAHHVAAATYRRLNKTFWNNIYYRAFYTATPFRSRDEERLLYESIAGPLAYKITYKEAVDLGAIVPVEAYYVDLPKREVKGYTWAQVYSELVVNNHHRNKLISDLLLKLKESGASTLCLVKEIAHGEQLAASSGILFANGLADNTRELILEFALDERKALIGTTGILGEGVDTKPAEYVIIAGLGRAKGQFMQQIGRGLRRYPRKDSCKIIIFKDRSHKWTLKHFREQCKILREEYGVEPVKLNI